MDYFISKQIQKNYYFEDSIAYTEDHIKVQKLSWCDAPRESLNKSSIQAYFESFGRVLQIQILEPLGESSLFGSGFVIFDNAKDAASALLQHHQFLNRMPFLIHASDSWEQPDAYGSSEELLNHQGLTPIFCLNDHCLELIMMELDLQDQVHFARACPRFRAFYQEAISRKYTTVDLSLFEEMTVWDMRDFFQLCGAHVQVLRGYCETIHLERLADFIRHYCCNLRSAFLSDFPQFGLHMHKIFAKTFQLVELRLENSDVTDEDLLMLQHLTNLKILNLSCNPIAGYSLDALPVSIEVLGLDDCVNLDARLLLQMCKRLTKLKELSIRNIKVYASGKKTFKSLVNKNFCPTLEVLQIPSFSGFEYVAQLPKLKHLTIYVNMLSRQKKFAKLFDQLKHKTSHLERLEIVDSPFWRWKTKHLIKITKLSGLRVLIISDFTLSDEVLTHLANLKKLEQIHFKSRSSFDSMFVHVFRACARLYYLRLDYCKQINVKLVLAIVNQVREEIANHDMQRRLPIELWSSMDIAQIKELILTSPDLLPGNIIQMKTIPNPVDGFNIDHLMDSESSSDFDEFD
ncbi:uncharacterized protein LOC108090917 [Drosophila ficusphila]|uniref:uncharacterized protein LOC108090917 n=1 Tax=Drosophila ficusphila TaxID=30025 RepID=UPI0007E62274|nr:uncharacterized protein LOC108090917 [Drosophila ficusphila]